MDIRQAIAEAKRRWGAGGIAWRRIKGSKALYAVGYDETHEGANHGFRAYGTSPVGFVEAFAEAARLSVERGES